MNIALEWLQEQRHNGCYYSLEPSTQFFHCRGSTMLLQCYYWPEPRSEPTALVSRCQARERFTPLSNSLCVSWPASLRGQIYAKMVGSRDTCWVLEETRSQAPPYNREETQIFQRSFHPLKWGRDPDVSSGKGLVTQTGRGHPRPIWLTLLISFRRQTKRQTVEQCKEKTESNLLWDAGGKSPKQLFII